jgi:hypothetical protein
MIDGTGPDHIEVNVHKASHKMAIRAHGSGMVPVFPEGTLSVFSIVVCLAGSSGNELHGLWNDVSLFGAIDEQMDMIRCDYIVKNLEPESFPGFKKPFDPAFPIHCEFEQEFLLVAPVSDMPNMLGKKISIRSWHDRA